MGFRPDLAEVRFGTGLSPRKAAPGSVAELLSRLTAMDRMAVAFPGSNFLERAAETQQWRQTRLKRKDSAEGLEAYRAMRRVVRQNMYRDLGMWIARGSETPSGFLERLTWFWTDHFTVGSPADQIRHWIPAYVEEAIRPNVTRSFPDMLVAVATHPVMIMYLDQHVSLGPGSRAGQRNKARGLNENLAREILELHTLGVGGSYSQVDVRELAELLTGLTVGPTRALRFRVNSAEPGAETILGRVYGGDDPKLSDIKEALRDIALHPDTARHIALKLATHFISDTPSEDLVQVLTAAYREHEGAFLPIYTALLEHPDAWSLPMRKVRRPLEFLVATARALDVGHLAPRAEDRVFRDTVFRPLAFMGQDWLNAPGPDGWPEEEAAWITPQGLAARIEWAMGVGERWTDRLPDPREFVHTALGDLASPRTIFAANGAETRAAGIGLILSSPEFQRR